MFFSVSLGLAFMFIGFHTSVYLWDFSFGPLSFSFPVFLDRISIRFIFTVRIISLRVILFSRDYIIQEPHYVRFHILVGRFVLSIFILILSPRLLFILIGWDGLGLTSYLLVIYFLRRKSFNSGILTAFRNRVGDSLILLRLGLRLGWFGRFTPTRFSRERRGVLVSLVLILAATTKRAQIPFRAWLPAAIAAPTPVSSLVHSSTLVTAGVYLIIRFYRPRLSGQKYMFICGLLTLLIARIRALKEVDLKKIIALSTLSQLGVIINCLGGGGQLLSFSHLVVHAFFKALIFICVGNIIHRVKRGQDFRESRIVFLGLPLRGRVIICCSLRLRGFPFIAAFYSKDLIVEIIIISKVSFWCWVLVIFSLCLTPLYRARFLKLIFNTGIVRPREGIIVAEGLKTKAGIIVLYFRSLLSGVWNLCFFLDSVTLYRVSWEIKNLVILILRVSILVSGLRMFMTNKRLISWNRGRMWALGPGVTKAIIKNCQLLLTRTMWHREKGAIFFVIEKFTFLKHSESRIMGTVSYGSSLGLMFLFFLILVCV